MKFAKLVSGRFLLEYCDVSWDGVSMCIIICVNGNSDVFMNSHRLANLPQRRIREFYEKLHLSMLGNSSLCPAILAFVHRQLNHDGLRSNHSHCNEHQLSIQYPFIKSKSSVNMNQSHRGLSPWSGTVDRATGTHENNFHVGRVWRFGYVKMKIEKRARIVRKTTNWGALFNGKHPMNSINRIIRYEEAFHAVMENLITERSFMLDSACATKQKWTARPRWRYSNHRNL